MTQNDAIDAESTATTATAAKIVRATTALIALVTIIGVIRLDHAMAKAAEIMSRDTAMTTVIETSGRVTRPTGEMIATTNVNTNPPTKTKIPQLKR